MKMLVLLLLVVAQLPTPMSLRLSAMPYGPQPTIICPVSAVPIGITDNLQAMMLAHPNGTVFCVKAGVHPITSSNTPRSGQTFIGEYGAILDGTGWVSSDPNDAAIKAHNADADDVTIRNLVVRNMPQKCLHAFSDHSDRWVFEYNELTKCKNGIGVPNASIVRGNWIHHNEGNPSGATAADWGGGYTGYLSVGVLMEENEISYNGCEQKFLGTQHVTFRNNYVHHNRCDGIWYDGENANAIIEGNRVEDNTRNGIFYEASLGGVIRNNIIRRQGDTGIFISTSQNTDAHTNTLDDNFRAITYFVNCGALPQRVDLTDNTVHHNTIRVDSTAGAFATGLSYSGDCSPTQIALYHDGSKRNTFTSNVYDVPNVGGAYWLWNGLTTFAQWQAISHDVTGTVQ